MKWWCNVVLWLLHMWLVQVDGAFVDDHSNNHGYLTSNCPDLNSQEQIALDKTHKLKSMQYKFDMEEEELPEKKIRISDMRSLFDPILHDPTQAIPETEFDLPTHHQIVMEKITSLENEIECIRKGQECFQKSVLSILSQINAKLDVMGSSSSCNTTPREPQIRIVEDTFQPVSNLEELQELDGLAGNTEFVQNSIHRITRICDRQAGAGWSVGLRIIDKFFTREFLTHCTWTGIGRNGTKHAISQFRNVVNLIHLCIQHIDTQWTETQNIKFLQSILHNSKTRYKRDKKIRMPTSRSRISRSDPLEN